MKKSIINGFAAALVVFLCGIYGVSYWLPSMGVLMVILIGDSLGFALTSQGRTQPDLDAKDHAVTFSNSISQSASRIAIGGATVSHFLDRLAGVFKQQVKNIEKIADSIRQLEAGNLQLLGFTTDAQTKIQLADEKARQSKTLLIKLVEQQTQLKIEIEASAKMLTTLKSKADSISGITTTINQLANQTNMLALNAAIEAARAGEQGRGFAVVADEVRDLAQKTTNATQGIDDVLSEINRYSQTSVQAIEKVSSANTTMSKVINDTTAQIEETSLIAADASTSMEQVAVTVQEHSNTNRMISVNAIALHENTQHLDSDLTDVSEKVLGLSYQTESIFRLLQSFEVDDRNGQVQRIATQTADSIGKLFEAAIAAGKIGEADLFNFNYEKVPKTNPQKYTSRFDRFTDSLLPAVQEPILEQNRFIIYAGAVDINGYFPTHNKKFSQPLTGDYAVDLAQSRTKRIFNDRTGLRCGQNTEVFLLQTYKRDTGEVMHDLSAPIYVKGRHWGGFRIGYKADDA